jgi:CBS domain-containing protein
MADFDDIDPTMVESDLHEIRGALLSDTIAVLGPAEPVCLRETASVQEAIERMLAHRQAGVLVIDADGRLMGIFTERDVLTRVAGLGRAPRQTTLGEVMTRDRVAYAVHSMSVAGYRTVPLVDAERRPLGVVTVSDVIRWLAGLFPEAVLNLPPAGALKHPHRIDAG